MNRDCSVLPDVEKEYKEIGDVLNSACKNPLIKASIKKYGERICVKKQRITRLKKC